MLDQITDRLDENLERVRNLARMYVPQGQGRQGVRDTDVLRAAVVLLHAGMEDYLRSLLIWKVDTFGPDVLKDFRLRLGDESKDKITLSELHVLRGQSVDDVISASVCEQIKRYQTFSDIGALKKTLKRCGIHYERIEALDLEQLTAMIARRHQIVHHADRNEDAQGRGNHKTRSIGGGQVTRFREAVEHLRDFVSDELA